MPSFNIDNILQDGLRLQRRVKLYDVNWTEHWNENPDDDVDTDPVTPVDAATPYRTMVLQSDPVHYWRLGEAAGPTADDIGSGNCDGTYVDGGTLFFNAQGAIENDVDMAVNFGSGTADYMQVSSGFGTDSGHKIINNSGAAGKQYSEATFEFWLYINAGFTAGSKYLCGKATSNVNYFSYADGVFCLYKDTATGKYYIVFGLDKASFERWTSIDYDKFKYYPKAEVQIGQWIHVVGVMHKGIRSLYLNGSLKDTAKTTMPGYVHTGKFYLNNIAGSAYAQEKSSPTGLTVKIDEFAIYRTALSALQIIRHYAKGKNQYSIDEANLAGLKNSLVDHWKLDETAGTTRYGSHTNNVPLTDVNTVTRPVGIIDYAAAFQTGTGNYLHYTIPVTPDPLFGTGDIPFTWGFAFYLENKANDYVFIEKRDSVKPSEYVIGYDQSDDRMYFEVLNADGVTTYRVNSNSAPTLNTWTWLMCWHDPDTNKIYMQLDNGTITETAMTGGCFNNTDGDLVFGASLVRSVQGRLDSVSFWRRILGDVEQAKWYNDGNGLAYEDFGTTDDIDPYKPLPTLINEQDVTEYISRYSINKDSANLIDAVEIECHEAWGVETIGSVFKANTYIKIEERYINMGYTVDSDWKSKGHYLVDGVTGESINSNGEKTINVTARGLLKLTTLDKANGEIVPDKILISRRAMEKVVDGTDTVEFQVPRLGFDGLYYQNWADSPSVRLWSSDFTPLPGDIVTVSDVLRLRGSEGATQILFGDGRVVFDRTYFTAAVKDNGFGDPGTVEVEAYRYAQGIDKVSAVDITGLYRTLDTAGNVVTAKIKISAAATGLNTDESYIGRSIVVRSGNAKGFRYKVIKTTYSAPDYYFWVVRFDNSVPDLTADGLTVFDYIDITDCNLIEEALTKALKRAGFQDNDSTKPFYIDLEPPALDGGVLIPPIKFSYDEEVSWADVVANIMQYAPPNYVLYTDPVDGITKTKTVVQQSVTNADHFLKTITDYYRDRSDFGVFTRVLVYGGERDTENVGLHIDQGGYSDVGAYKLDNFWSANDQDGVTKTQNQADTIIKQISNADPKLPSFQDENDSNRYVYGGIYRLYGPTCVRWSMEDSDIMWMDIGLNPSTGGMYEIDQIDLTVLPPFYNGTQIRQSMQVFYMTDADFTNQMTMKAPLPGAANYNVTRTRMEDNAYIGKDNQAWKLLVDEFACEEGETIVPADQFETQKPTKVRFLKFRVCQPYHRGKQDVAPYRNNPLSIIVLNDVKVWTSRRIIQSAELGLTPPFESSDFSALKARLRRRTFILRDNPYLDTTKKAQDFALQELKERYSEFSPHTFTAIAPTVDIFETIKFINPNNDVTYSALVKSVRHNSDGTANITAIDYSIY